MPALFGRTTHEELAAFLDQHGQRWNVGANRAFMEHVTHLPLETEDLIAAIRGYAPESEWVYFASDWFPAEEVSHFFSLEEARNVNAADLDQFRIRTVRGSDFLYVFCSAEDVCNGSYITLLPAPETEEDDL
jgi:hypothetical protein